MNTEMGNPELNLIQSSLMALTMLALNTGSSEGAAVVQAQPVALTVADNGQGADLAPHFLGLSYEMSMLLPKDGRYYFDPNDQALVNSFKTLGIKSLRVGANAVDDPSSPSPRKRTLTSFSTSPGPPGCR